MPTTRHNSRGAASLASRYGTTSATKRATGLTDAELRCLVAVASAWTAEGAYPTRYAIQAITKGGSSNMPSNLVAIGLLVPMDRTEDGFAVYGVTPAGRALVERALADEEKSA